MGLLWSLASMTMAVLAVQLPAQPTVKAITHVAVIPMEDTNRVLTDQTIIVRGNRIAALGPAATVAVPTGALRVDGRGKFLLPGLADMHMHLAYPDRFTSERLFLYLANGITTVREMMSDSSLVSIKQRIAKGTLLGPQLYTAYLSDLSPRRPVAAVVAAAASGGYDFIKFYGDTDEVTLDSLVAAAGRVGLRVVGHMAPQPGIVAALRARVASIEHLWGYLEYLGVPSYVTLPTTVPQTTLIDTALWMRPEYQLDSTKLRTIVAATRQAGVWNTPTLDVLRDGLGDSSLESRMFQFHQAITKALADGGAGLLLGTDRPNLMESPMLAGFLVHQELELLVGTGLSPYRALEAGTRNAATFLGTLDSMGTVAVGKRADLLLVSGNPLQDVRYTALPAGVMVRGQWFSRAAIDDSVNAIAVRVSRSPDKGRLSQFNGERLRRKLEELRQSVWRSPTAP